MTPARTSWMVAACVAVFAACHRQATAPLGAEARRTAVSVLQDASSGLFVSEPEISQVATAIQRLRAEYSDLRSIEANSGSSIELRFTDSVARAVHQRLPAQRRDSVDPGGARWVGDTIVAHLRLQGLDRVNATLGVTRGSLLVWDERRSVLYPHFARPVNRAAAANMYQGAPEIRSAVYGMTIGDGDDIRATRDSTGLTLHFSKGWGDCPAGCINRHHWIYHLRWRDGRLTKLREYGTPIPAQPR